MIQDLAEGIDKAGLYYIVFAARTEPYGDKAGFRQVNDNEERIRQHSDNNDVNSNNGDNNNVNGNNGHSSENEQLSEDSAFE